MLVQSRRTMDQCPYRDNPLERILTWQLLSKASTIDMVPTAGHPVVIHRPLPRGSQGGYSRGLPSTLPKEKGNWMERVKHGMVFTPL